MNHSHSPQPLPPSVQQWLEHQDLGRIEQTERLAGGSINQVLRVTTTSDECFVVKLNPHCAEDFFLAEARSLQLLGRTGCVAVPEVYHAGPDFLLMEYLPASNRSSHYWEQLGESLAHLHQQPADGFGFPFDTYCGSTLQPNDPLKDGYQFFSERRLIHQARLARDQDLLERSDTRAVELLCERLPELIPTQAPAPLHGDLWSGNVHCGPQGRAYLIDPAAYYGWPEADLAMTRLFGGFDGAFLQAYQQVRPLEPGFEQRIPIYNLYHLLNHLNLFGEAYLRQVRQVLERFRR